MKTAVARPRVAWQSHDPDVAHLGVAAAEDSLAIDNQANAHTGADRDVGKVVEPLRSAPLTLAKCRAVHVGIEADRNPERVREAARDTRVAPAGFGGGSNVTVSRRRPREIERTERGQAQRFE